MTQSEVVLRYCRANPERALFVTLTCAGDVSPVAAQHGLNNFWRRLKRAGYDTSRYVVAREFQKRGVAHYHILWFTSAYIANDAVIAAAWRLGYTKTMAVDSQRASWYVSKYMGKGLGARLHASLRARVQSSAKAVVVQWHNLGIALWRYNIRMTYFIEKYNNDSGALAVASRYVWRRVVENAACPVVMPI
jgi:hypothetical protein